MIWHRMSPLIPCPLSPLFLAIGSYDAWAALCVEALGIVDGDWANALQFLRDTSAVTHRGPYGQAHELPPDAPSAFKTKRGFTRFIADNGEIRRFRPSRRIAEGRRVQFAKGSLVGQFVRPHINAILFLERSLASPGSHVSLCCVCA